MLQSIENNSESPVGLRPALTYLENIDAERNTQVRQYKLIFTCSWNYCKFTPRSTLNNVTAALFVGVFTQPMEEWCNYPMAIY